MALPLFVSAYPILAKTVADDATGSASWPAWLWHVLISPTFILLAAVEIGSLGLWIYILARVPLSVAFPLSAISYIVVLLASWTLFDEPGNMLQLIGTAAILAGIYWIGRSAPAARSVTDPTC